MRRSLFATITTILATTATVGCRDDIPSGPELRPERPRLSSSTQEPFKYDISGVANERVPTLQPTSTSAAVWGGDGQAAMISSSRADFPREGSRYLVVSSGSATEFDRDSWTKSTRYQTACTSDGRCDVGGVDLVLGVPSGATSAVLNFRYYTWDGGAKADPFHIYVVDDEGNATVASGGVATIQSEFLLGNGPTTMGNLRYGDFLRSVSIPVNAGQTQLRLRFEASDTPDGSTFENMGGGFDSGALIDNIRFVSDLADGAAPVVKGTQLDPTPVPWNQASSLTSVVDDAGTGGSGIGAAEYQVDGGPFGAMPAASGYSFGTPTVLVQQWLPAYPAATVTVRTVCVRGQDVRGNVSGTDCTEQAVYDPAQGYVAGSGMFESLPGAYTATGNRYVDYAVAGPAQFGFSSRYRNGKSTPSGRTRFTFRAGKLTFESASYEYLIVSAAQARYKGRGRLRFNEDPVVFNGARLAGDDYGFLVSATDGDLPGGGGTDKVRFKIWRLLDGAVVYDSQRGSTSHADSKDLDDGAEPLTAITGGRILIKK
jgi:hypothetical protein